MSQASSRLALLIQMLGITGNDLANSLGIDPSLISKWKHNRRRVPGRSDTMRHIADYLLTIDEEQDGRALKPLLTALSKGKQPAHDEAVDLLTQWLMESNQADWFPDVENSTQVRLDQNSYVCQMEVFRGLAGRRIATLRFLDKIMALPADRQLLLMTQEDISWVDSDPDFREQFKKRLDAWVSTGHQLEVIHWIDRKPEHLNSIVQHWLPLHLDSQVNAWYYPVYEDLHLPFTLIVVPGYLALEGSMTNWAPEDYHTLLFSDQATVRQCEWMFRKIQKDCTLLVENYQPRETQQIINRFAESWQQVGNKVISLQSNLPLTLGLPREKLDQVLIDNHFDSSSRERLLQLWFTYGCSCHPGRPAGNRVRLIHHYEASEKILSQQEYTDELLSSLAGKTVKVKVQYYRDMLLTMAQAVKEDDSYEIALARSDIFNRSVWPNYLVVSNTFLTVWGSKAGQNQLFAREATLVHAFEHYFNERWQQIPRINRDRQIVADQLIELAGFNRE